MLKNHLIQTGKKNSFLKHQNSISVASFALLATTLSSSIVSFPAQAATAVWSPEQIVTNLQATNVHTAVNTSGISAVIWDQYILGSADSAHLYGRWQVFASVCTPQPAPQTPNCSAPYAFTDGIHVPDATNAGVVVAPSGAVTVFWDSFPTPTAYSASATSVDSGNNWLDQGQVPGSPGYTLLSGVYAQVGPSVGVDGNGNIIAVMVNPPAISPITSTGYSVQTLVKPAGGNWSSPVQLSSGTGIFGSGKLFVNSDGQALFNLGFTSFRRDINGNWGAPKTIPIAGMGQIYSASAGFDAGGKGYFVYRTRYLGAFLAISTPTTPNPNPAWSKPKHIAKFDILGSSLIVRGSSAGHAIVYGNDMNTGNVRATVSSDCGATWGGLTNFGLGSNPYAAGSENGLFALSWDSAGVNWDRYMVATGTGIGTGTTAWIKKSLVGNNANGPVSIAGNVMGGSAYTVAGWIRWDNLSNILGVSSGIVNP